MDEVTLFYFLCHSLSLLKHRFHFVVVFSLSILINQAFTFFKKNLGDPVFTFFSFHFSFVTNLGGRVTDHTFNFSLITFSFSQIRVDEVTLLSLFADFSHYPFS